MSSLHEEAISVSDGEASHVENTNITVIAINNEPSVGTIGVKTVWTHGENQTFYEEVGVVDTEDGTQTSGNFTFNLTFLNGVAPFFNISEFGIMDFTANVTYFGAGNASKVYNLSLCVTDRNLTSYHQNISLCGMQNSTNWTVCQNFSLTVTAENRAPRIVSYFNSILNLSVQGTSTLSFNVSETDDDGTIPDCYWYADDVFKEYDSGSLVDEFSYSFGCGVSGVHTIKAFVTDGELNDSVQWNVTVGYVVCPTGGAGAGGGWGGGGISLFCLEKWSCDDWDVCRNVALNLDTGILVGEDYRDVQKECSEFGWDEEFCGYQTRDCFDANTCNTTYQELSAIQSCYYTEDPSCFDGIKNCHDGGCEF